MSAEYQARLTLDGENADRQLAKALEPANSRSEPTRTRNLVCGGSRSIATLVGRFSE